MCGGEGRGLRVMIIMGYEFCPMGVVCLLITNDKGLCIFYDND